MKHLLLVFAALLMAPAAMAQWTYSGNFPSNGPTLTPHNHGLAVAPDGKVWIQSYYPFTLDSVQVDPAIVANSSTANCSKRTNNCRVSALHVLNPDGSEASFSPLSIITLPGGVKDTLGGGVVRNATGQRVWDWNSGRGLTAGPDGSIYASVGSATVLYKFNYRTGEVMDFVRTSVLDARGGTAPGVDNAGNVFITGVFNGDPLALYNSNLDFVENVVAKDAGFNRTVYAVPSGNKVILPNYSRKVATIYSRPDEFSPWDSTGATFRGMAVESVTTHPVTGNVWVSSGSTVSDKPTGRYQPDRWYEFTLQDVLNNQTPTPRDSIIYNNIPATAKPRAIAFTPDGMTAYVGVFDTGNPAVQKFTKGGTSTEGTIERLASLGQNQPNPFSGSTDISYSLEQPAYTRLRVLDLTGREVAVLVDAQMSVGEHRATFRSQGLASGVYVYMLEVDGQATTRRMLHIVR